MGYWASRIKEKPSGDLTLEEFSKSQRTLTLFSYQWGEDFLVVGDEAILLPGEKRALYRCREVAILGTYHPDAESLRFIHECKKTFGPGTELLEFTPNFAEEASR